MPTKDWTTANEILSPRVQLASAPCIFTLRNYSGELEDGAEHLLAIDGHQQGRRVGIVYSHKTRSSV